MCVWDHGYPGESAHKGPAREHDEAGRVSVSEHLTLPETRRSTYSGRAASTTPQLGPLPPTRRRGPAGPLRARDVERGYGACSDKRRRPFEFFIGLRGESRPRERRADPLGRKDQRPRSPGASTRSVFLYYMKSSRGRL